uniref:Uncharacterized protein n=1 Tax=viral metagenome TaxID=1070528 RepID=A0A6M3IVD3_9ZZZZ
MQITVKSAKVLKSGTSKSGEWELIGLTSEDGTNYTTFHKNAKNLTAGTIIDIGEPEIKEGKISFKEYKVVSEAPAPAGNGKSDSHQGMTPADWAEKDRVQRLSIESQVAFKGIMEAFSAGQLKPDSQYVKTALDWAMAHFKTSQSTTKPLPAVTKSKSDKVDADSSSLVFNNAGELKTACNKVLKMSVKQIENETQLFDLNTEKGRKDCWQAIVAVYGEKDEKGTTEAEDLFE